jgi:hypothetical protein
VVFDMRSDAADIVLHFSPKLQKLPLHRSLVAELLANAIITYRKNFTGKTLDVLTLMYHQLALDKWTKKKLHHRKLEVKVAGIREAAAMNLIEFTDKIGQYAHHPNTMLRMEAQAAYIKLSAKTPFLLLDNLKDEISDWQQAVLFEVITKNKQLAIPSFARWLNSTNNGLVLLSLKLVEHYMQFDAGPAIAKLLKHSNPKVVKKAIQVVGHLELAEAEKQMFEIYFDHTLEIRLEILSSLGKISSGNYNEFLYSRLHSSEAEIRREALYAIKRNPNGEKQLLALYEHATLDNQALIKHVLET